MKLHLGCGERYLDGYINIDYPPDKHTVQTKSVADKYHDITNLKYSKTSVEEIRLHHVFEHFPRAQAVGLLICWQSWLKPNGRLAIEVPDFDQSLKLINQDKFKHKYQKILRHIFGSQEASWAVHYNGWDEFQLKQLAESLGYKEVMTTKNTWNDLANLTMEFYKNGNSNKKELRKAGIAFLSQYLVDNSQTEQKILQTWISQLDNQLKSGWGN